jgi:hypothetical protein
MNLFVSKSFFWPIVLATFKFESNWIHYCLFDFDFNSCTQCELERTFVLNWGQFFHWQLEWCQLWPMFQSGGLNFERLEAVDGTLDPIRASHLIRLWKRVSTTLQPKSHLLSSGWIANFQLCLLENVPKLILVMLKPIDCWILSKCWPLHPCISRQNVSLACWQKSTFLSIVWCCKQTTANKIWLMNSEIQWKSQFVKICTPSPVLVTSTILPTAYCISLGFKNGKIGEPKNKVVDACFAQSKNQWNPTQ